MSNEGKSCDAALQWLEDETKAVRSNIWIPNTDRGVDIRVTLAKKDYAIEHTFIEPFDGQVSQNYSARKYFDSVRAEIEPDLPFPGVYCLIVPLEPRPNKKARQFPVYKNNLRAWVIEAVHRLNGSCQFQGNEAGTLELGDAMVRGRPVNFPYELRLINQSDWRQPNSSTDRQLDFAREAPTNIEEPRQQALRKALESHCPKLEICKRQGAVSVLVLEFADTQLSNDVVIAEALRTEILRRVDQPDKLFLVASHMTPWRVWQLSLNDIDSGRSAPRTFDSKVLENITLA